MSTGTNIWDLVEHRIGGSVLEADKVLLLNRAIRIIAKRLFSFHKSDLQKKPGGFAISFAIEAEYGDVPSDFWGLYDRPYENDKLFSLGPVPNQETILKYKPRTKDSNQGNLSYTTESTLSTFTDDDQDFDDWDNDGSGGTIYKIVVTNSDATVSWAYLGEEVSATEVEVYSDFALETTGWNGTAVSGKTPSSYEVQYQATGAPRYYELMGTRLYVYPRKNAAFTLHGEYFFKPTALTASGDTMPYSELFDDIIEEYLIKIEQIKNEKEAYKDASVLREFLWEAVDSVVIHRAKEAPKEHVDDSIDYSDLW